MRARGRIGSIAVVALLGSGALAFAGDLKQAKKTVAIGFNEQKSVVAKCPGGTHAAWGGFEGTVTGNISTGNQKVYTYGLVPEGKDIDRFTVDADNGSPPGDFDNKVTSYAYCAKGKKPVVTTASTTVADEDESGVSAACPEGKIVVGGGFETDFVNTQGPHMTITYLGRGTGQSFQVQIANVSGDGLGLTAYAVCGKGKAPKEVQSETVNLRKGKPKKASATCPKKQDLVFGGVTGTYDFVNGIAMPFALYEKGEGVEAVAAGDISSSESFSAIAYCR